jgi:hypothetical protein
MEIFTLYFKNYSKSINTYWQNVEVSTVQAGYVYIYIYIYKYIHIYVTFSVVPINYSLLTITLYFLG